MPRHFPLTVWTGEDGDEEGVSEEEEQEEHSVSSQETVSRNYKKHKKSLQNAARN